MQDDIIFAHFGGFLKKKVKRSYKARYVTSIIRMALSEPSEGNCLTRHAKQVKRFS